MTNQPEARRAATTARLEALLDGDRATAQERAAVPVAALQRLHRLRAQDEMRHFIDSMTTAVTAVGNTIREAFTTIADNIAAILAALPTQRPLNPHNRPLLTNGRKPAHRRNHR